MHQCIYFLLIVDIELRSSTRLICVLSKHACIFFIRISNKKTLLLLLLLLLVVEVLHQLLLSTSLGPHRELSSDWLLGCWMYCLKLLSLSLLLLLLLLLLVKGACRLWWCCRLLRLLLLLLLLLEEVLLLVLGSGLGLGGQTLCLGSRCLLWGGWSLWLLGLR